MKLVCKECDWRGDEGGVLRAPNPFMPEWEVAGCPGCFQVDPFREACDEPGCWQETCCGTPTPTGYRRTCSKHVPREVQPYRAPDDAAEEEAEAAHYAQPRNNGSDPEE